jgi:hypothetical protein
MDFFTDTSTFLYVLFVVDVNDELYLVDTTLLEPPVYDDMVDVFKIEV